MKGHLDEIAPPRERLVDGVVDDLEHEMVEPAGARPGGGHARAQPDRIEALQDRDVFRSVGSFSHRKKPCNSRVYGLDTAYQNERSEEPRSRLAAAAFATAFRSSSSSIPAASDSACVRVSGRTTSDSLLASSADSAEVDGSRPGAKRSCFGTLSPSLARKRSRTSASRWVSSNAHVDELVATCSVPSRASRAGHALRAISDPTASGHTATSSISPRAGSKRPSSRRAFS